MECEWGGGGGGVRVCGVCVWSMLYGCDPHTPGHALMSHTTWGPLPGDGPPPHTHTHSSFGGSLKKVKGSCMEVASL